MRAIGIIDFYKIIKSFLLLEEVISGRDGRLFFQGEMHALMATVLLRFTGLDAFDGDAEAKPPDGEFAQAEESAATGERHSIVAADSTRQTIVFEGSFKDTEGELLAGALQPFAVTSVTPVRPDRCGGA